MFPSNTNAVPVFCKGNFNFDRKPTNVNNFFCKWLFYFVEETIQGGWLHQYDMYFSVLIKRVYIRVN